MFSVLLSIYHKENPAFLDTSLHSIFNQTLMPNEVVLIKDGKLTPELDSVLDRYQAQYPDIFKVYTLSENSRLGVSLSYGLNLCSNEIVARMDTDDICLPFRFEEQYTLLKNHPELDLVGFNTIEFDQDPSVALAYRNLPEKSEEIYKFGKRRNPINHPTVMFRRFKALEAGNYRRMRFYTGTEDYLLWMHMLQAGMKFYNIQKVGVLCRVGNDLISRRHGFLYYLNEIECFAKGFKIGYIGLADLCRAVVIRGIVRIVPKPITKWFYYHFLRQNNPTKHG